MRENVVWEVIQERIREKQKFIGCESGMGVMAGHLHKSQIVRSCFNVIIGKGKLRLVIVGTSGSGLFDAGVGARHPASGGQFWPPEKNRKWPEVGIRIFYHFFKKHVQFHIICVLKPLETIFSLATAMINNIFLWKRFKSKFKTY